MNNKRINLAISILGISLDSKAADLIRAIVSSKNEAEMPLLEGESWLQEFRSQIVKMLGLSPGDRQIELLTQEARIKYYKQHGRWPEEDGVCINVNI